jgi:3-oxoacyl-ACP reductase-like protein
MSIRQIQSLEFSRRWRTKPTTGYNEPTIKNLNLNGKTALVSTSRSGIGHAIAAQLLEDGARVIINGRNAA